MAQNVNMLGIMLTGYNKVKLTHHELIGERDPFGECCGISVKVEGVVWVGHV